MRACGTYELAQQAQFALPNLAAGARTTHQLPKSVARPQDYGRAHQHARQHYRALFRCPSCTCAGAVRARLANTMDDQVQPVPLACVFENWLKRGTDCP